MGCAESRADADSLCSLRFSGRDCSRGLLHFTQEHPLPLVWDSEVAVTSGSNKTVHTGTYGQERVVICFSRNSCPEHVTRAWNEIKFLRKVGSHPCVTRLLTWGSFRGRPYLVLEAVLPIGFDLGRLWSQHELMEAKLPSSLCARLFLHLLEGLEHLHAAEVLHLDLKMSNVLVTADYGAKLCDFGLACVFGSTSNVASPYMSPEACSGDTALGPEADCWGLGLILHQLYQRGDHKLIERCSSERDLTSSRGLRVAPWRAPGMAQGRCRLRQGKPSTRSRMPREVREVMLGLLTESPDERLSLAAMRRSEWLSWEESGSTRPLQEGEAASQWMVPYESSTPPLSLALRVGMELTQLDGKTLEELDLQRDPGVLSVMCLKLPCGQVLFEPEASAKVVRGTWMFVGIAPGDRTKHALLRVGRALLLPGCETPRVQSQPTAVLLNQLLGYPDGSMAARVPDLSPASSRVSPGGDSGEKAVKDLERSVAVPGLSLAQGLFAGITTSTRDFDSVDDSAGNSSRSRNSAPDDRLDSCCSEYPGYLSEQQAGPPRYSEVVLSMGLHNWEKLDPVQVRRSGATFTVFQEFDCFRLPAHVEMACTAGVSTFTCRTLRSILGTGLVGVQRVGQRDAEWFPDGDSVLRGGDTGIVVRRPSKCGTSVNPVGESELARLMSREQFLSDIRNSSKKSQLSGLLGDPV